MSQSRLVWPRRASRTAPPTNQLSCPARMSVWAISSTAEGGFRRFAPSVCGLSPLSLPTYASHRHTRRKRRDLRIQGGRALRSRARPDAPRHLGAPRSPRQDRPAPHASAGRRARSRDRVRAHPRRLGLLGPHRRRSMSRCGDVLATLLLRLGLRVARHGARLDGLLRLPRPDACRARVRLALLQELASRGRDSDTGASQRRDAARRTQALIRTARSRR